jgi:hypothetical protein
MPGLAAGLFHNRRTVLLEAARCRDSRSASPTPAWAVPVFRLPSADRDRPRDLMRMGWLAPVTGVTPARAIE